MGRLLLPVCLLFFAATVYGSSFEASEGLPYTLHAINDNNVILLSDRNQNMYFLGNNGLTPLNTTEHLVDINNTGRMVGSVFLYIPGANPLYYDLGGRSAQTVAISDGGILLANYTDAPQTAFTLNTQIENPIPTEFNLVTGGYSQAFSINRNAQSASPNQAHIIVGEAVNPLGEIHAFAWFNGTLMDLGKTAGSSSSRGSDVNAHGKVLINSFNDLGDAGQAIIHDLNSGIQEIIPLPQGEFLPNRLLAKKINDNNYVIGDVTNSNLFDWGVLYRNGTTEVLADITTDRYLNSPAHDINNNNVIIVNDRYGRGRILRPQSTYPLLTLVVPRYKIFSTIRQEDKSFDLQDNTMAYLVARSRVAVRRLNPVTFGPIEQEFPLGDEVVEPASFGHTIALFGDYLVVGAPLDSRGGVAYVYRYNESEWTFQQVLVNPTSIAGEEFAAEIVISQDRMAIAATKYSDTTISNKGIVYSYRLDTNGQWQPAANPVSPPQSENYDQFGFDMAMQGDRLLIAVKRNIMWLYTKSGDAWLNPLPLNLAANNFIHSVDLSGDRAVALTAYSNISIPNSILTFDLSDNGRLSSVQFPTEIYSTIALNQDTMVGKHILKKRPQAWFKLGTIAGNAYSITPGQIVASDGNYIRRYALVDYPESARDSQLNLSHNKPVSYPSGEVFNYQISVANQGDTVEPYLLLRHYSSLSTAEITQFPAGCEQSQNNGVYCLIRNLSPNSSVTLDFGMRINIEGFQSLYSVLMTAKPNLGINAINSSVLAYRDSPSIRISNPIEGSHIVLPPQLKSLNLDLNFENSLSGNFVYKIYLNGNLYADNVNSNQLNLNLGEGNYQFTIQAFDNSGNAIVIDGLPVIATVNFSIFSPYIRFLSPANELQWDQENAEYLVSFVSNADFSFQKIEWRINQEHILQHESMRPISIPKAFLKPGENTIRAQIININGNAESPFKEMVIRLRDSRLGNIPE